MVVDLYYPVGSFDEPPGLSGLAHFVEHMLFKGTERFPKGQIDRLVHGGGRPVQCRDRRGQHALLVHVPGGSLGAMPWRSRPIGCAHARFDPGEVELERRGDRRGAGARAGLAAGPARPEPPGRRICAIPTAIRSSAGPRTPRGSAPTTWSGSTDGTTGPTARCWSSSGMWTRGGHRSDRGGLRGNPAGGRGPAASAVEPGAVGSAQLRAARARRRGAGGCWAGAPCPAGHRGRRRARRALRPPRRADGGRDSGTSWWRPAGLAPGSRRRTPRAQRGGQLLIQLEADPGCIPAAIERADPRELPRPGRAGPTPDELARSDAGSMRPGAGSATTWRPGLRPGPRGALGRLADLARGDTGPRSP